MEMNDIIPKNNNIHTLDDYKKELDILRETGLQKGAAVGFKQMHEHYSCKRGSTTYIIASPGAGKTSLVYEMLINLAQFKGWRFAIFSPEAGSPRDLFAEILWAVLKMPFLKHDINNKHRRNATDKEVERAFKFVSEHFFIIDSGLREMNVERFYTSVDDIETEKGIKIDGLVIDPVLELNINPNNLREDVALNSFLTKVRKYSSEKDIHTFVAVHTRAMQLMTGANEDGEKMFYYGQPSFYDVAGGLNYSRKGMMIMSLWRPPQGLIKPDGSTYHSNETIVEILKVKPKITGKLGKFSLFYDYWSSRYYEIINGEHYYAQDIEAIEAGKAKHLVQTNLPF